VGGNRCRDMSRDPRTRTGDVFFVGFRAEVSDFAQRINRDWRRFLPWVPLNRPPTAACQDATDDVFQDASQDADHSVGEDAAEWSPPRWLVLGYQRGAQGVREDVSEVSPLAP
jgi:hypothetical protein